MISTIAAASELAGGWSWTVWLLIPAALVLAYVTARVLGPDGDPPPSRVERRHLGRPEREVER